MKTNKNKSFKDKFKLKDKVKKIINPVIILLTFLFGEESKEILVKSSSSVKDNSIVHENIIQDPDMNSCENNYREIILTNSSSNVPIPPTNRGGTPTPPNYGPTNFPSSKSISRPRVPTYRFRRPVVVNQAFPGNDIVNPNNGQGDPDKGGGSSKPEFDEQCSMPEKQKSDTISEETAFQQQQQEKKKNPEQEKKEREKAKKEREQKKKDREEAKKRKRHLNLQIEKNDELFEIERYQAERKTVNHGTDFFLEADYTPAGKIIRDPATGKARARLNKKNIIEFINNIAAFVLKFTSERHECTYRMKQDVIAFVDHVTRRFVIFDKYKKTYVTGWVMGVDQYIRFLETNDIT